MSLFLPRSILSLIGFLGFASALSADPADVESWRDYAGFPRMGGFIITDYDEDNPSSFDFPVARPLPIDADHVEVMHVEGHRIAIRYELAADSRPVSLIDSQLYYEKLALSAGFTVEKTGAVGGVSETFRQRKNGHEVWIYLEPGPAINILTVVEATRVVPPAPSRAPPVDESLYGNLRQKGRVALPLNFLPSKPDLDADAQPMLDRVSALLRLHPDLRLQIEGHTDATADPVEDRRLSLQRARTVMAVLISEGIDKDRLEATGLGGSVPRSLDTTVEGRAENRRIELVVRPKEN